MAQQFGYLVELNTVKLSDDMTSEIMLFPFGKYDHPVYGEMDFTPQVGADVVKNFDSQARGQDIDIDYDHKAYDGTAAGWIKKVFSKADGVYAAIEWTKKAWDHIQNKEYRYFSPEFADEWTHPQTGQVFKNILFGGGITNRPFLKGILPINMSELGMPSERPQEGKGMDPEKLRELLGLPKDATDEQVEAALTVRQEEGGDGADEGTDEGTEGDGAPEGQEQAKAANEGLSEEVVQLAESNPAIKSLVERITALGNQLSVTQTALQLTETQSIVKSFTEGKNALPASSADKLTKVLMASDAKTRSELISLFEDMKGTGLVQLGEDGRERHENDDQNGSKKFNDKVAEVMANDKLSYADAAERVASLHPELYGEHVGGSYAFKEA